MKGDFLRWVKHQSYFGSFRLVENSRLECTTRFMKNETTRDVTELRKLGDIVYFIVMKDDLVKIGETTNVYTRFFSTYCQKTITCKTTKKIVSFMKNNSIEFADIFFIKVPRRMCEIYDSYTGLKITSSISILKDEESRLQHHYLSESNENRLPCCTQIRKVK